MVNNDDAKVRATPRREVPPICIWVTDEERKIIIETARSCGLSISAYARNLALGYRPSSILDLKETRNLFEAKADLGRLGGLLKLWLTDDIRYRNEHGEPIEVLMAKISEAQDRLTAIIHRIDETINPVV